MTRVKVAVLGGLQVSLNGQLVAGLETNRPGKPAALLAYLVVENREIHTRQALADIFWPERGQAEAFDSLRFALSNLRTILGERDTETPLLFVDRYRVGLNPDASLWLDAAAFELQAQVCAAQSEPNPFALRSTLDLYRGAFLSGLSSGESLPFENWIVNKREHYARMQMRLLQQLADVQMEADQMELAEETLRSILAIQASDEPTHRRLMALLAATGRRSAALEQYYICRQELFEDLGVEPVRETNLLYHQIKAQAEAEASSPKEAHNTLFVGRQHELSRLDAMLDRVLLGRGGAAIITGEAGSGKTALLSQFSRQALACQPRLLVIGGQCSAYSGLGQPYLPFIEALQMLAGEWETLPWAAHLPPDGETRLELALPDVIQQFIEFAPGLLGRFVRIPDLLQRAQEQTANLPSPPPWLGELRKSLPHRAVKNTSLESSALFEQFTRLLLSLTQRYPILLILDDVHWIDPDSAALLFHLFRRAFASRIFILIAYRPAEIEHRQAHGEHPLPGIVTELQRQAGGIRIDLDQADETEFVTTFLQEDPLLHPHRLDKDFCASLIKQTGGNPLFTIELLRSLQARGDLVRDTDGVWVTSPKLDWGYLPARVEAAIAGRMSRLPDEWLDRLMTASVEGESFAIETLARVHHLEPQILLNEISGPHSHSSSVRRILVAEGAIKSSGRSLNIYRFRHSLYHTYLYQQIDPLDRARRHAAVGLALEELYAQAVELTDPRHLPTEISAAQRAAALAHHFDLGGLPEKAAIHYLAAGGMSHQLGSAAGAIAFYRRGIELLAETPRSPERDRLKIRLYLALSTPFLWPSGRGVRDRQEAISHALSLLKNLGGDVDVNDLLPALYAQADWLISQDEMQQAASLGQQMLDLAQHHRGLLLTIAHYCIALPMLFQGDLVSARFHLEEAIKEYSAAGQPPTLALLGNDIECLCRGFLGVQLAYLGHTQQGWTQAMQALNRARTLHNPIPLCTALMTACEAACLIGDLNAIQSLSQEILQIGREEEMRFFEAYGLEFQGYSQSRLAEPGSEQARAGLRMLQRGMGLWESTGARAARGLWVIHLVEACLHAQEIEAGLAAIEDALSIPSNRGIGPGLPQIMRLKGELLLRWDPPDPAEAERLLMHALMLSREKGLQTVELDICLSLGRLWRETRPMQAIHVLDDICSRFTGSKDNPSFLAAQELLQSL